MTDGWVFQSFEETCDVITTTTGSNLNRFRFTGREWDSETNLYYYRARYYDSAVGRSLARIRSGSAEALSSCLCIYDVFGRRATKTISGTATSFFYDGANAVQELSGTTPTANLLSGSIDEIFQRTDASGASSFLSDALGSTLALADASGALQTTYSYDPF